MIHRFSGSDKASARTRLYNVSEKLDFRTTIVDGSSYRYLKGCRLRHLINSILMIWKIYSLKDKTDVFIFNKSLVGSNLSIAERYLLSQERVIFGLDDAEFLIRDKVDMVFKKADLVFAGSHYIKERAEKFNDNVYLIPTPIDTENFRPMSKSEPNFVIGWVGDANAHQDNLELLIEPLESLSDQIDFKFILVGSLGNTTVENKFSKAEFKTEIIEWVEPSKVPEQINRFDVGVMPLKSNDEFLKGKCALKALEYMSCEVPAVASRVGENKYAIKQGKTGFLVESDEEWVKKILELKDDDLRARLGKNARQHVLKNYSVEKISHKIARLIRKEFKL